MPAVPWRVGATSFVYRAGWLENVERLGPRVDDVEILFFDIDGEHGLPDAAELRGLAISKARHGLTYTLHTPLDASLASFDDERRADGVRKVCTAMQVARPLAPEHTIVHVYLGDGEADPAPPRDLDAWRARAAQSLRQIVAATGIAPRALCVELIDYDFALIEPVIEALDLSVALDVGHLWRDGAEVAPVLRRNLHRVRVVQCHGTDATGRDHVSLCEAPRGRVVELLRALRQKPCVLTLEVFGEADFESSLALLRSLREADAPRVAS